MFGHASLGMVEHYAQMVDDDLLHARAGVGQRLDNFSVLFFRSFHFKIGQILY